MYPLKVALIWVFVSLIHAQYYPWEGRNRMTSDEYQSTFNDLVGKGYRLTYVSGYTLNNIAQYAAVWENQPSPEWVAKHGMTSSDYQTAFDTYTQQGFRLVLVNGYEVNGQDYYVAIWDKSPPPSAWVAKHGMTATDYQQNFDDFVNKGYRLTHVSGYSLDNVPLFAAIWELRNDGIQWVARHGMTSSEYQTQFDTYVAQGYTLVDVTGYQVNNIDYYAAIWDKSGGFFRARHGLTFPQYQSEFNNDVYQGYVLKVVSGYTLGTDDRYAVIWVNAVMSPTDISFIDNKITTYMTNYTVPGLTIAIAKDDRLVFAKGYGLADTGPAQTPVDPTSMFRIASISKSFTAVTIMWLTEHYASSFPNGIDTRVFGPGALLGTIYATNKNYSPRIRDISVRHLLEHSAGWNASDPEIDVTGQPLATRTQGEMITHVLDDVPQIRNPGDFAEYLNFGYLVLGVIIETVTNQNYELFVQNTIMKECQITKMQVALDNQKLRNEVNYYPNSLSAISKFEAFGGWVATAIDLTRLMVKVDQIGTDDILSATDLSLMYTVEPAARDFITYAKGWIVVNSYRGHNGALQGTRSFFAQMTTGGYSFAAIGNDNVLGSSEEYSFNLESVMESICTGVSKWPDYDLYGVTVELP